MASQHSSAAGFYWDPYHMHQCNDTLTHLPAKKLNHLLRDWPRAKCLRLWRVYIPTHNNAATQSRSTTLTYTELPPALVQKQTRQVLLSISMLPHARTSLFNRIRCWGGHKRASPTPLSSTRATEQSSTHSLTQSIKLQPMHQPSPP